MRQTAYLTHPSCLLHDMGRGHPESPARLQAIDDQLIAQRLADFLYRIDAPGASIEQLERVHDPDYVRFIFECAPQSGMVHVDHETLMNPHTLEAALHAAGASVAAVDLVLSGQVRNAFCAVRPPGHHAEHDRAMGFCLFNNVAVAAAHALTDGGLERVAVLDFDVHHGNGTENIFQGNDRLLYCSIYQYPFYPYIAPGVVASNIVRCPLPAGSDTEAYQQAVSEQWLPQLRRFEPQMLLVSAGFDAHRMDPLADMRLSEDDFRWITQTLVDYADEHCDGRLISTLEGGYDLGALARSACVHVRSLMGM